VAVAKRVNKVPAQVLLKWSIVERNGHGHNRRRAAVTSGVNAAYGVEDLALWGWDLSAEDIASLDTIAIAPDDPVKGMCVL
jgi:diketogulonate reductase-like aldo/keto reductase